MQRLGILKLIVSHSTNVPVSGLSSVSETLKKSLSEKIAVSQDDLQLEYFARIFPSKFGSKGPKMTRGDRPRQSSWVELQDLYLSAPEIPSKRGRLGIPDDFARFPQFGVALKLIRPDSAALLSRGQLLKELTPQVELDAFRRYSEEANPYLLTQAQSLFFLLTILESDASVIPSLYRALPGPRNTFKDMEAGDLLPGILSAAVENVPARSLSTADRLKLKNIRDTADGIDARRGERFGKTVREQNITPRLEPFVDIGILKKPDPYVYEYRITDQGFTFFQGISEGDSVQQQIDQHFFSLATKVFGLELDEIEGMETRLRVLYEAWNRLRSATGYASINETSILASIVGIEEELGYLELKTALETLHQARDLDRELLRLNINRSGTITSIKFLKPLE